MALVERLSIRYKGGAGLILETGIAMNLVIYFSVFSFHVFCSLKVIGTTSPTT